MIPEDHEVFLVTGEIEETPYMGETKRFDDTRIVVARDRDEARRKFTEYWHQKTEDYCQYYTAQVVKVNEVIF